MLAAATGMTLAVGYSAISLTARIGRTLDSYDSIPKKLNIIADRISNPTAGTLTIVESSVQKTANHANAIMDDLDREPGHGKPQGTIQTVNKLLNATSSVVTHVDLVARHYEQQMTEQDARVSVIAKDVHSSLQDLDASIRATRPLLDAATQAVGSVNVSVNTIAPRLQKLIESSGYTMDNLAGVTADGKRIADDLTQKYFTPIPWYKKIGLYVEDTAKAAKYFFPW